MTKTSVKAKAGTADAALPRGARDPAWVRRLLIGFLFLHVGLVILLPFAHVLATAFSKGAEAYLHALSDKDSRAAIGLTLLTAAVVVPLNTALGVCLAWGLTRRPFAGRRLVLALIDLPLSISPVVVGLLFLLVFGKNGWLGGWLEAYGVKVIFAVPGVVLATLFVTLPFVARELIPLMAAGTKEAEEAARLLGAGSWRIFRKITLPEIKWGLLYGVVLCNARAMGEFGAVSVVSGHIRGKTDTLPLHIEALFNDYDLAAANAVASLLALLGVVTLVARGLTEWHTARSRRAGQAAAAKERTGP
jgi:sulfate transport system permease protein